MMITKKLNCLLTSLILILIFSSNAFSENKNVEQFQYLSPVPDAVFVSPFNDLIIRYGEELDESTVSADLIEVTASISGVHDGEVILLEDKKTMLFQFFNSFEYDDTVTVSLLPGIKTSGGAPVPEMTYTYYVSSFSYYYGTQAPPDDPTDNDIPDIMKAGDAGKVKNDELLFDKTEYLESRHLPDDFPPMKVDRYGEPNPGYLMLTPFAWKDSVLGNYIVMMDNWGTPVFYKSYPDSVFSAEFKIHPNGYVTFFDATKRHFAIYDSSFNKIGHIKHRNGYLNDFHELLVTEDNHKWVMTYDHQWVDLTDSLEGGMPNTELVGLIIQELDENDNVIFQWRSWDNFSIFDAHLPGVRYDTNASTIDYVHGNAIEIESDTAVLISSRNLSEITKIDRRTGEIIWRFGGKNNSFDIQNDDRVLSWQHDCRRWSNGNLSAFDNGVHHDNPYSGAVEYKIDEENMTAELIYRHIIDEDHLARVTGSSRHLDNGNLLVSWGSARFPNISEYDSLGNRVLDVSYPSINYRTYRYPWKTTLFGTDIEMIDYQSFVIGDPVKNNITLSTDSSDNIEISSYHTNYDAFSITEDIPLDIPGEGSTEIELIFDPQENGYYEDVLTLNHDYETSRIARQVHLKAIVFNSMDPVSLSFEPQDSSENVPVDKKIVINFSEAVQTEEGNKLTQLNAAGFIMLEDSATGETVPFSATISGLKKTITVKPDNPFDSASTYYVGIKDGLMDYRDEAVVVDSAKFSTPEYPSSIYEEPVSEIKLYPNPANDQIYLENESNLLIEKVDIVNSFGKKVRQLQNITGTLNKIEMSGQSPGLYFVRIFTFDGKIYRYKFIKR